MVVMAFCFFIRDVKLTLAFGGIELFGDNSFDVSSAWINFIVDSSQTYLIQLQCWRKLPVAMDG